MVKHPILQFVQSVCGSGKTIKMVEEVIKSDALHYIIAAPTIELSQEISEKFKKKGLEPTLVNSDNTSRMVGQHIASKLTEHCQRSEKTILIITVTALINLTSNDSIEKLGEFKVIIDEIPESYTEIQYVRIPDWDNSKHIWKDWLVVENSSDSHDHQEIHIRKECIPQALSFIEKRQSKESKSCPDSYSDEFYRLLEHLADIENFAILYKRSGDSVILYNNISSIVRIIKTAKSVTMMSNNVTQSLLVQMLNKIEGVKLQELHWKLDKNYNHGSKVKIYVMIKSKSGKTIKYTTTLSNRKLNPDLPNSYTVKEALFAKVNELLLKKAVSSMCGMNKNISPPLIIANSDDLDKFSSCDTDIASSGGLAVSSLCDTHTNAVHGLNKWKDKDMVFYLANCRLSPEERSYLKILERKHNIEGLIEGAEIQRTYEPCLQCLMRSSFRDSPHQDLKQVEEVFFYVPSIDHAEYVKRYIPDATISFEHAIEIVESSEKEAHEIDILINVLKTKIAHLGIQKNRGKLLMKEILEMFGISRDQFERWKIKHRDILESMGLLKERRGATV